MSVFRSVYINIYLVHFWIIYIKVFNCGMTVGTSVKIMPFCGCCGCRLFLVYLKPAGFTYCALTPSIPFLRMKVPDKLRGFDNFFDKLFDKLTLCTLLAHHLVCLLLPPSCALKLWLVLPTPPGARSTRPNQSFMFPHR